MGPAYDGQRRRKGRAGDLVTDRLRRSAVGAALGACCALWGAERSAGAQPTALSAVEIYDRSHARVAARVLPPYIIYTQDVTFVGHRRSRTEHERVTVRMADGKANIVRVPDSPDDRVDERPRIADRPLVYPTTTFGFVRRSGEEPSVFENPSAPGADTPPVIGRVRAVSRAYTPTLVGIETLDGVPVYHLTLVPNADPDHRPIRAMWIDTQGFDPRRIAIELRARKGPVTSRPTVTVDFAPVDGVWLIRRATTDFTLRFAFLQYRGGGAFAVRDVAFPSTVPPTTFGPVASTAPIRSVDGPAP